LTSRPALFLPIPGNREKESVSSSIAFICSPHPFPALCEIQSGNVHAAEQGTGFLLDEFLHFFNGIV